MEFDIEPVVRKIWTNPQKKNLIVLSLILLLMLIISIRGFINRPEEIPPGSIQAVMCSKCGQKYQERIVDISEGGHKCKFCREKLGTAYKCLDCDLEFCVLPQAIYVPRGKTMELFNRGVEITRCPNCKSISTVPVSVKEFKIRK